MKSPPASTYFFFFFKKIPLPCKLKSRAWEWQVCLSASAHSARGYALHLLGTY